MMNSFGRPRIALDPRPHLSVRQLMPLVASFALMSAACGDDEGDAGDEDRACSIADNSLVHSVWPGSAGVFSLKIVNSSPLTGHTETGDNQLTVEVLDARGLPVTDAVITGVATTHSQTSANDAVSVVGFVDTAQPGTGIHTITGLNYSGARVWQLVFTVEDELRSDRIAGIEQCVAQDPTNAADEDTTDSGGDDTGSTESGSSSGSSSANSSESDADSGTTGSESGSSDVSGSTGTSGETGTDAGTSDTADETTDSGTDNTTDGVDSTETDSGDTDSSASTGESSST